MEVYTNKFWLQDTINLYSKKNRIYFLVAPVRRTGFWNYLINANFFVQTHSMTNK